MRATAACARIGSTPGGRIDGDRVDVLALHREATPVDAGANQEASAALPRAVGSRQIAERGAATLDRGDGRDGGVGVGRPDPPGWIRHQPRSRQPPVIRRWMSWMLMRMTSAMRTAKPVR